MTDPIESKRLTELLARAPLLPWRADVLSHKGRADTICVYGCDGVSEVIQWSGFDGGPRLAKSQRIATAKLAALAPALAAEVLALRAERAKMLEAAQRVLEWWPENAENGSAGKRMGSGFDRDIQSLRATITDIMKAGG
jgi:hypothetical protein